MYSTRSAIVVLCSVLAPSVSPAQDDITKAGHRCAAMTDSAQRLACFDRLFVSAGPTATEPGARDPAHAPVMVAESAAAANTADDFGLTKAQKQAADPDKVPKAERGEITAVVTGVTRRKTGETLVTLDNGQVWLQSDMTIKLLLKEGTTVTIGSGALGSYFLRANDRPSVRVRRVK
jgi:hypothetical protein